MAHGFLRPSTCPLVDDQGAKRVSSRSDRRTAESALPMRCNGHSVREQRCERVMREFLVKQNRLLRAIHRTILCSARRLSPARIRAIVTDDYTAQRAALYRYRFACPWAESRWVNVAQRTKRDLSRVAVDLKPHVTLRVRKSRKCDRLDRVQARRIQAV